MQNLQTIDKGAFGPAQEQPDVDPSCALLVISCDKYQDLWRPFFTLLWRHWPDNPFPVYLGSNKAILDDPRVRTLARGSDQSWSRNLRWYLEQLETGYVLTLFDDFFLHRNIETMQLTAHLAELHRLGGTVLRLFPKPGPDGDLPESSRIGTIHPQAPYRVSAQPAFWNREALLAMLDDDEDAWQWEWNGTERSRSLGGFYATFEAALPYRHVVERGQWFWTAARDYKAANIGCDWSARPVMGPWTAARKAANRWRKDFVRSLLPIHLRRRQ